MTIRFLQTLDSGVPNYPFMAGQIVRVAQPTPSMLAYLQRGYAEAVKDDEPEFAVVRAAAPSKRKAKRRRA